MTRDSAKPGALQLPHFNHGIAAGFLIICQFESGVNIIRWPIILSPDPNLRL